MSRHLQGLRGWMLQRISAVYMGGFIVYFVIRLLAGRPWSHAAWHAWLTHPVMRIAAAVFVVMVLAHAWVGMRDIVLDYFKRLGLRLAALAGIGLLLGASGLWALQVLLVTPG